MLFLCLMILSTSLEHPVFQDLTDLKPTLVKSFDDLDARVYKLSFYDDDTVIIFSYPDKKILQYRCSDRSVTVLAEQGPGPDEIQGALVHGFVFDDLIVYKDMSHRIKAFQPGRPHRTIIEEPWTIGSCVPVDGVAVCVNMTFSEQINPGSANHGLVIMDILEDGTWQKIGSLHDADVIGHEPDDIHFALNTLLLPSGNKATFYRYPRFLYPNIQVMTSHGDVVDQIPVAHPVAANLPNSPEFRRKYRLAYDARITPLRDVAVDPHGNLYSVVINASGRKDISGRVLAIQSRQGDLVGNYLSPIPMSRIAIHPEGRRLIFSDEDDHLYEAMIP